MRSLGALAMGAARVAVSVLVLVVVPGGWVAAGPRAHGDPMGAGAGPAANHPPGTTETETETETTTGAASRAAPIANAHRDRIRRAGRFTPLTLIKVDMKVIEKTCESCKNRT